MRWKKGRRSANVEDRRGVRVGGSGMGGFGRGGGGGLFKLLPLAFRFLGVKGTLVLLVVVVLIPLLLAILPTTLVPIEDRGTFITFIRAPQGSTSAYTEQAMRQVEAKLAETPEVAGFFAAIGLGFGGVADSAEGIVFTRLHPWEERDRSQQEIVSELFPHFIGIPQALVFPINPPSWGRAAAASPRSRR